jgi:hypothetical protein
VFLVILGLLWEPQRKTKKDLKEEKALQLGDGADPSSFMLEDTPLTQEQTRNYLRRVLMRVLLVVFGILGIVVGLLSGSASVADMSALLFFMALYGGMLLIVQRSEKTRRIMVLWIMGFVGLLIWRTAEFRGSESEHEWGLLIAATANALFWYFIGQRFPPVSSDAIEVIGLE